MSDKPAADAMEPISVRIPEAIRLTGLSRSGLYELLRDGEIDYVKVGSSTLILVDSLRAFICSRSREKQRPARQSPGSAPAAE